MMNTISPFMNGESPTSAPVSSVTVQNVAGEFLADEFGRQLRSRCVFEPVAERFKIFESGRSETRSFSRIWRTCCT